MKADAITVLVRDGMRPSWSNSSCVDVYYPAVGPESQAGAARIARRRLGGPVVLESVSVMGRGSYRYRHRLQ